MAYFAQLDENNIVQQVISISNEDAPDPAPQNSEPLGQSFIANVLGLPGVWKQTSYNNNLRKQYCGPGFTYDEAADVFISPQPFASWTLDENYDWQPPTPMPEEGLWSWNEESLSWIDITPEQPYPSWTLDENYIWQPPTPMPEEGIWDWNEDTLSWIEITE